MCIEHLPVIIVPCSDDSVRSYRRVNDAIVNCLQRGMDYNFTCDNDHYDEPPESQVCILCIPGIFNLCSANNYV